MLHRRDFFRTATAGAVGLGLAGTNPTDPAVAQTQGQMEAGVFSGWVTLLDFNKTGSEGMGLWIYDLLQAEYQVALFGLDANARYSAYLVESRPPEVPGVPPLDWTAWGGPDTAARDGDDSKFLRLGEIRTNDWGDGLLSVDWGEASASLVRPFNMLGIYPGQRAPEQSYSEAILTCNGDAYGVVPAVPPPE